jgi:hypothetical protein
MDHASALLSERRFWNVIQRSLNCADGVMFRRTEQEAALKREIHRLSKDECTGFLGHFYHKYFSAYRHALKAVEYVIFGGCSGGQFMDFRKWLVLRGKQVYEAAIENPDSLCDEFDKIPQGDLPEWDIYFESWIDERFGEGSHDKMYHTFEFPEEEYTDEENEWNAKDEASIRRICPITFEKYWLNDRF